ncbi:MAG: hypothetical protein FGF53_06635 [Candidatus Brockarchaeota archaeon]|nr:hypothetical protein [Candidatus Brockarchaeota archaeon]
MLKAIQSPLTRVGFYVVPIAMLLLLSLPTIAAPGSFEIVSLTTDTYKVRGGQAALITVRVRSNLGYTATAIVAIYSEKKIFFSDRMVLTITLRPGEEGDVYFGAYYGGGLGEKEETDEIIVLVEDTDGNLCDRKTLTLRAAPSIALWLEGVSMGFLESGKWAPLNVTVHNYQVITREAEVRVKAPPPFRVEPTGIIKPCGFDETKFTFQITVDTSKEVNGTLEILLCYEGEIIDRNYVSITGYPPQRQESSTLPSLLESLIFFILILAVAIILFYFLRTSRQNVHEQLPPPPPPTPP